FRRLTPAATVRRDPGCARTKARRLRKITSLLTGPLGAFSMARGHWRRVKSRGAFVFPLRGTSPMIAMSFRLRAWLVAGACALVLNGGASTGEKKDRDIFDYDAQKAADGFKRIVFIADTRPHGARGNHEFVAASVFLARTLNAQDPKCWAVV